MPATYEPIATTTLGSAAANITFSSIGSGYTDLRVILVGLSDSSADSIYMQVNSDTGSNYSRTQLVGDGASAASYRSTSATFIRASDAFMTTTIPTFLQIDWFNYAGSTNKTCLISASQDRNGSGAVSRSVGLWRSTSAITSIKLYPAAVNFAAGTTATLYGILKA